MQRNQTPDPLLSNGGALPTGLAAAQQCVSMVNQRQPEAVDPRVQQAGQRDLPEVKGFAQGLRRDDAAGRAACCLPGRRGQVEEPITRWKLRVSAQLRQGQVRLGATACASCRIRSSFSHRANEPKFTGQQQSYSGENHPSEGNDIIGVRRCMVEGL